jgi:hypothetical protein
MVSSRFLELWYNWIRRMRSGLLWWWADTATAMRKLKQRSPAFSATLAVQHSLPHSPVISSTAQRNDSRRCVSPCRQKPHPTQCFGGVQDAAISQQGMTSRTYTDLQVVALVLVRNVACRLRNARPNHQPSAVPPRLTILCKLLVACVIAMGPFLGIAAAAVMGARPTDPLLLAQSMQMRKASVTVCTAWRTLSR